MQTNKETEVNESDNKTKETTMNLPANTETQTVAEFAFVSAGPRGGEPARVSGNARVYGHSRVYGKDRDKSDTQ